MGNRSLDDFLGGEPEASDERSDGPPDERLDDGDDETETAASDRGPTDETVSGDGDRAADEPGGGATEDADSPDDGGGENDGPDDGDDGSAGATAESPRVDPAAVEPAAATYAWRGDGGVCDACGERVDRRWRQDGTLVCPECKDW